MTDKEKQLNKEMAELRNMHKFIGKYLNVLEENGRAAIVGEKCLHHAGQDIGETLKKMVSQYPRGIEGSADDFLFYKQVMFKLHEALIMVGVEGVIDDAKRKAAERNIEQSLNDLLGFK